MLTTAAGAVAAPTFTARGSVEQVYVTGLAPGAQVSLLEQRRQDGRHAAGQRAGRRCCSATCRRGAATACVPPRAARRPDPLTVLSTQPAPPSTGRLQPDDPLQRLRLPDDPRRHQAGDRRPSAAGRGRTRCRCRAGRRRPQRALPRPLIEYSGYGYADPAGPQSGIAILANLMGFTVVDVNMRGTGCSGGAFDFFEPLQNLDGYDVIETIARQPWVAAPQGRDDGHLLRRDQPALHRPDPAAEPGRDLAALGDRRDADDALPGRHPQHRVRRRLGPGARPRRPAGVGRPAASPGPTSGSRRATQTCTANQALHPEAADLMAKIRANDHYVPDGRRPAGAGHVRRQDQRAGLHGLPVDRRADRRALPDPGRALHRHAPQVVHVHQRHPRRLARPGDLQPLVRLPRALRRATGADRELRGDPRRRAGDLPGGDGDHRASRCRPTRSSCSRPTRPRWRRSSSCRRSASCSTTAPAARSPASPYPGFERSWPSFPIPGTTARSWYLAPERRARRRSRPRSTGADAFTWDAHARPLTDFTGDTAAGAGGLWTATPTYQWTQSPAGQRGLVPDRAR